METKVNLMGWVDIIKEAQFERYNISYAYEYFKVMLLFLKSWT